MSTTLVLAAFFAFALLANFLWTRRSRSQERAAREICADVAALGDDLVPASLHPVVDPAVCMGSGACVRACPEHDVIGLVDGRVKLVNPLACVGHGACAAACPVNAINLVFGTAKRGVELPVVDPTFQTNQPGIYIVGELGGMGLIRNAIEQGSQAAEFIAAGERRGGGEILDAVVVGAGPAGISATLGLQEAQRRVLLIERESFGGTITHYPRAKVVMTGTLDLPIIGKIRRRTMSKEQLIELWERIRTEAQLPLVTGQLVEAIEPASEGSWIVRTSEARYQAANVVLALGRRGSPRKLGVPGEDQPKVAYRLLEPDPYRGKHVMIVGGGNAAAECALALADDGGCASVAISYRRTEFARLRRKVRDRLEEAISAGVVEGLLGTQVSSIAEDEVHLTGGDGECLSRRNDAVIVQIGGTPPTALLERFGIATVTKRGEA